MQSQSKATRPPADFRATTKPLSTTIDDTCRITGLGRTKVYELIAEGKLKTATIGRRRLVMYSSIEALVRGAAA